MSADKLLELAESCELATGPDRELDIAIALALSTWAYGGKPGHFYNAGPYYEGAQDRIGFLADDGSCNLPGNAPDMMVPKFTASIDAAMTLYVEDDYYCMFALERDVRDGVRWVARLDSHGDECGHGDSIIGEGNTAPLALTALFLRFRAGAS